MIRNLIFDMGGVLIRFDRELFLDRLELEKPDRQLLMNQVFLSLEWARMDRGSMTEDQAVESIRARVPQRLHGAVEALVKHWDEPLLPVEGMEELIRELSAQKLDVIVIQNDMTPMPDIQCLSKTFRLEQQEGTPDHIRLVEAQEEDSDLLRVVWPKNQNSPVVRYFLKCLSDR